MKIYPLSDEGLTIFLFHGVLPSLKYAVRNYLRKHIEAEYFERLCRAWRNDGVQLSMEDVLRHSESGKPFPARSFAITFDDGFLNNLTVAAPILESLSLPATFYVTSKFIDQNGMSWTDRMEWALERHATGRVRLPWRDAPVLFSSVAERKEILSEIRRVAKSDRSVDREALATSINLDLNEKPVVASDDPLDKKMSWAEAAQLAKNPLFIIGGHSHTHPILSFLNDLELEAEIYTSQALIAKHFGSKPHHYAYPEGLAHCFDARVIATLKRHGVKCCPTAINGVNTTDDPFHLFRVMVD